MARFNGIPVKESGGGSFGGIPLEDEEEPKSNSVIDTVSRGISAIADDFTSGRAAVRKRERADTMARGNEAGRAMAEDQQASGNYDELQQRAQQIAATKAAEDSTIQAGVDSARDLALGGIKGAANTFVKLPLAATGIALDATGTRDIAARLGVRNREALQSVDSFGKSMDSLKSDSGKARDAIMESTKGFTDTLITLGTRPAIIADQIAESLVGTVAVGATAGIAVRQFMPKFIAQAEAAGLTGAAAEAFISQQATKAAIAAAAGGEGVQAGLDVAGTAQAAGRGIDQYGLPAAGAAVGTAAIGAASGGVARKLGIGDIETDIALRGTRGAAKTEPGFLVNRVAVEGFKEGVLEEMPQSTQEAAMENIAMGRPWDQGLGKAAATGLATGAGMGAGHAAMSRADQGVADGGTFGGVPLDGAVPAGDLLDTPSAGTETGITGGVQQAPTESDKALYTPKNLTALDRVNEIDAALPTAPEADRESLQVERAAITASWPKATPGAETSFTTETGARLAGQYALMEAGDLTTSHDENLRPTATYPTELQPRARDRHASEVQIQGIVGKLDPARLGESADVATGAPIVGADGLVESGNARTIALKRVYQANGLKADTYKQFIKDNAARFGITPESIDAMQKPVLVRVRSTPVNRAEFARQANASTVARMSPSEQAKTDAAQIDSLDDLNPDESGDFMSGSSRPFVRRFLAKLAGTEQAGLIDATGQLSQAGYTRLRNAVLAKAYGDSPVLLRMVESLDDNSRNVSKALLRVAPQVAKAREGMREGALHDVDLIPDLMAAVEELSDLKDKGVSVDQALAQAGMFGDKLSPEATQLMVLLSENARSPRRIADFIQAYLDALTAAGNPGQGSMFGDNAAPSKADLMTAARRANDADTKTAAASGTDAGTTKPAEKSGSQPQDAPRDQAGNGGNEAARGSAPAVGGEWRLFGQETGTLGIPRAEMPQVKGDHRGALIQFLDARGITHKTVEMPADKLKPTQAEYSTKKAAGWKEAREGVDRSVLASSDGYILDGHHQWVAAREAGETEQVIQFSAPIKELLAAVYQFPSAQRSEGGNVVELRANARKDFKDALADLAQIASKHTRAAMLPENTPNLMPTLIKLSSAAIAEVGYQIKDIIAHVKQALRSNEEFKKFWNKIDNAIYRKAALQAAEQASMAHVEDLFSMAEERKGQTDLFSQPPAKKAEKPAVDPQSWDERRKGNYKAPALESVVPDDVATRVRALVAKWKGNLPEAKISDEDRIKAEAMLEPVIATAKRDEPGFDAAVKEIAAEAGIGYQLGPTKKIGRAAIKLVDEDFDLNEMKDIVRATIVVPSYDMAQSVIDVIASRFKIRQINNKTALEIKAPAGAVLKPKGVSPEGYSDVTAFVRLPGGGTAEIQINTPETLSGKDEGHILYEGSRVVEDDPDRQAEYAELRDGQIDLYSATSLANAKNWASVQEWINDPTGNAFRSMSSLVSSLKRKTLPSGNSTQVAELLSSWNLVPGGNLSGTFITSTPSDASIAKPGSEVYTDGKEKSSGGENGQNGDSGSQGAQGKEPGAAPAIDGTGQAPVVPGGSVGPDQRPNLDAGGASGQPAGGKQGKKPAGKGRDPQDGGRDGDRDSAGGNAGVPAGRDIPAKTGRNYAFGDGDLTYAGSWQVKARQNVEAVELLKKLEKDGRQATREEQATLAKFIGWGSSEIANSIFGDKLDKQLAALANYEEAIERLGDKPYLTNSSHYNYSAAFSLLKSKNEALNWYTAGNITKAMLDAAKPDASVKRWGDLRDRLKAAVTNDEWDAASRSTQYAHYTSKPVVKALLGAVSKMGFKGGTILEPGAGIGVFPGLMDSAMGTNSIYTGIEFDPITGGILKQLFPDERILVESFIDSKLPENFYDVAFGNPPFSGEVTVLADPKYVKHAFKLHDYFFAKSIDSVKPGGLVVFVTSRYTMDKKTDKARAFMAERADLVGAIRLPQTAFQKNAGTEVVTDVLFLRKKVPGQTFDKAQSWMGLGEVTTPEGKFLINEYFTAHPEMVLGEHSGKGKMQNSPGPQYTLLAKPGDIEAQIVATADTLPADVFVAGRGSAAEAAKVREMDFDPKAKKEGSFYVSDAGVLMQRERGVGSRADEKYQKNAPLIKDYITLRDAVKQSQLDQLNDGDWESSLKALQKAYADFTAKNGRLFQHTTYMQKVKVEELDEDGVPTGEKVDDEEQRRRFPMIAALRADPEYTLALALENFNEETGEIKDSDWLTKRTLGKPAEAEIRTPSDALLATLNDTGAVDIAAVADRLGMSETETIDALGSLIYEDPAQGWVMADEYLSGNVKKKLAEAEEAVKSDKAFARNIEALKEVQPAPRSPEQITPQIGMNWIPGEVYEQFLQDVTGVKAKIEYVKRTRDWVLTTISGEGSARATSDWGVGDKAHAGWLMEKALTGAAISLNKSVSDGKGGSKQVFDPVRTEAANEKRSELRAKFREWLFQDAARTTELVQLYNDKFNTSVQRKFDGTHLTLPGTSKLFNIFDHVKRGAWRVIQTGNTYLAHAVGSGKTFEMVISAMEQKRLGKIKKPMIIVPGHMLQQFASEWQQLYPTARLMVADETDFHTENRRRFVSRVAMSDLDGVIMTHSSFGLLDLDPVFKQKMIEQELEVLRASYEEAGGDLDDIGDKKVRKDPKIKRIESQIEKLEQQLAKAMSSEGKDKNVRFDEMGVDMLYVDEAHLFRKLSFATARQTKGIAPMGSQMAWDLYMKTRWLAEKNPTRNLVMASGTAITNTTAELYTVQRFMAPQVLEENGLAGFDDWASQFGEESTTIESTASGKYEPVTRFQEFVNVGEMTQMFRDFADVLNEDQLAALLGDKRPKVKGGARKMVITPKTETFAKFLTEDLAPRIEASKNWKPSFEQQFNPDPIIAINIDARLASIDMRFMEPSLPNDPDSKLNKLIDGVIRIAKETENNEYRGKSTKDADGKEVLADFEAIKGSTQMVFFESGFGKMVAQRRGFNARAWMEKRLRDAGIPASQIAFMEDYKKSSAKLKLFADVNKGKVRVLVGSSAAMGTGVNAQQRLIALHHLDAPYVPAILEQREGRIIRQGNKNPEVQVYAYSTFGSFDENLWQMLARKKFFIEQAMSGDPNIRTIEDVGEVNQLQMAAGLVAENPFVMQLAGARADVTKMTRLYQNHEDQRARHHDDYINAGRSIEYNEKALPAAEKAAARVKDLRGDAFVAKVGKQEFTKRKEWGEAILAKYKEFADQMGSTQTKIGEISGFDVMVEGRMNGSGDFTEYRSALGLMTPVTTVLSHDPNVDPVGMVTRANNALVEVSREPDRMRKIIEEMTAKRASLESRLDAPFPLAEQLANKAKEVADLEDKVINYGKAAPPSLKFDPDEWANAYTPLFKRTAAFPAGLSPEKVKQVIDSAVKGLRNPPLTKYVATVADLPFPAPADVAGVFWDGKVWMVAANITSAEHAREVFAHEALGHYGLRGFFGAMLDGALAAIHDRNPRVRQSVVEWKARNADVIETYKTKYGMSDADVQSLAIEEAMSNWAQERGPIKGALRLLSLVQRAIRAMGMKAWANKLEAKTNAEALTMLQKARMFVRDGAKLKAPKVDAIYPAMADGTLADDLTRQEKWLDREAKLRGFKSIDDLAEKNYKVFENLALLWRKKNPVEVALMSRGDGVHLDKSADDGSRYVVRNSKTGKIVGGPYQNRYTARRGRDRLDNAYGAYIHRIEQTAEATTAPLFSRAPTGSAPPIRNSQTANRTAADIINASAGTARPLDFLVRKATQGVRLDRLTTGAYNVAGTLLDRYTPETIKAGMVSDYGIPESVIDQRAVTQGRQKQLTRAAGNLLEKLATLTRAESRVAYQWMNSADPQSSDYFMDQLPPESIKTLAEVEKMIDGLSKEAVALGQLSPEAYKTNRFAYLRRSYQKHEAELTKGDAKMRKRAIAILGDQYKGRGMTDAAPMKRIQNLAPEWWGRKTVAGKADKGLKGEKFVRLERRQAVGQGVAQMSGFTPGGQKAKLLEIAYWPASEPVPARYGAWERAGTWEVRDTKGADLILWRDFTAQEREAMGEIDEARYAIAKTLHGMIHDVETGKYLQWLAQNHAKKQGEKIAGEIVEASDRMRDVFKPGEWVKVPDTVIPGTQVKKYGTLAGRYLPGPIWNDVRQVVGFRYQPLGETYAKIQRAWKTSKTALSPGVHMNNVMANMVMADWHDVTAGHILKALKLMLAKDAAAAEVIARFSDSGGSIGTWAAKELQQDQMRPIIEALEKELGLAGNVAGQVGVMSALQLALKGQFPSAWEAIKPSAPGKATVAAARAMIDMYEAEDQVFRLAAWLRAKEAGATDLEAGKLARKSFLDYSINAPWVQAMRSTVLPFVAFTYRAVPMLLETAAKKPWKILKLGMLAGAINAMGYMLSGGDEDDERKLLPEEKSGKVWGIVPKLVRMPWNDANGSPVFLDIRRWIPVGDVLDVGQSHSAIPLLPGMTPGGPIALMMEFALDKVGFTGKGITLETDTPAEAAAKTLDWLYKAFAPNIAILPGSHAFTGIVNASKGRTDSFGREQSTAQAIASSLGVKAASYPQDVLQLNAQRAAQAKLMEIDRNITALKRELMRNGITDEEFQAKAAAQMDKKMKVVEDLNKRMDGG